MNCVRALACGDTFCLPLTHVDGRLAKFTRAFIQRWLGPCQHFSSLLCAHLVSSVLCLKVSVSVSACTASVLPCCNPMAGPLHHGRDGPGKHSHVRRIVISYHLCPSFCQSPPIAIGHAPHLSIIVPAVHYHAAYGTYCCCSLSLVTVGCPDFLGAFSVCSPILALHVTSSR